MSVAGYVTDFADQAVLLPMTVVLGVILFVGGWRRGALAWFAAIGGVLGAMLALKMLALACGRHWAPVALHSPSGHTATAAVVLGGLLALALHRVLGHDRWTIYGAGTFAIVFGTSRLMLGVHTVPDVLAGGAVGVIGAIVMVKLAGPPPHRLHFGWLAIVAAGVAAATHGLHMPAEAAINDAVTTLWGTTC